MTEIPERLRLSPTSWAVFEQCPRRYRLRYIERLPDPPGPAAAEGTFAHAVLEALYDCPPEDRTMERARAIAADLWEWGAQLTESVGVAPRQFKRAAWNAVVGDFEIEHPAEVDVHSTEHRHEWTEGDAPMVCVIDRTDRNGRDTLNPGLAVNDYKSGKVPTRDDAVAKAKRQIAVNALAVRDMEGPLAVARMGALLYVTHETVVPVEITPAVLDRTATEANETWAALVEAYTADDWPPMPSGLCPWCPWVAQCPEGATEVRRALAYWRNPPPDDAAGVAALRMLEAS